MRHLTQARWALCCAGVLLGSPALHAADKNDPLPQSVAEPVPPLPNSPATPIHPAPASRAEPIAPAPEAPPQSAAQKPAGPAVPITPPAKGPAPGDEVDLIGDKPEAVAADARKPLMEELTGVPPLDEKARHCYELLGEIKTEMEQISKDLDDNGKEVTRLIKTSEKLSHKVTGLATLWADNDEFIDKCGTAKRDALRLNDELSQVPRVWTHVRWAFADALNDIRLIRRLARDLAEAEPKPVAVAGKDGKVTYVEPPPNPVDPAIAKRQDAEARAKAMRETLRRQEAARTAPGLKTQDDN